MNVTMGYSKPFDDVNMKLDGVWVLSSDTSLLVILRHTIRTSW